MEESRSLLTLLLSSARSEKILNLITSVLRKGEAWSLHLVPIQRAGQGLGRCATRIVNFEAVATSETLINYLVLLKLTMESITIKVEESLAKEIDKAMKPDYSTKTEFVREAIRDKLKAIRTQKALEALQRNFGKAKVQTPLEEDRKIREEVAKEFAKKFGIELE